MSQNFAEAVKWFRAAAEQGHINAQFNLAGAYSNGRGVPQDYTEVVAWFRRAAEQGDSGASYSLGRIYGAGEGVPQNYAEAVRWYRLAAEQGDAEAQNNLGVMYERGEGVRQDYVQAHKWYNLAAARITDESRVTAVKNRNIAAAKMTPGQIAEAQKLASEWKPKVALPFSGYSRLYERPERTYVGFVRN